MPCPVTWHRFRCPFTKICVFLKPVIEQKSNLVFSTSGCQCLLAEAEQDSTCVLRNRLAVSPRCKFQGVFSTWTKVSHGIVSKITRKWRVLFAVALAACLLQWCNGWLEYYFKTWTTKMQHPSLQLKEYWSHTGINTIFLFNVSLSLNEAL